jgi:hypothetical protein
MNNEKNQNHQSNPHPQTREGGQQDQNTRSKGPTGSPAKAK